MEASSKESLRWYPRVTISKYSADQVNYARERCEVPWPHRLSLPRREVVDGTLLRLLFREPEGGIVEDEGNGVVIGGLENLALVLTGTGGHPLAPGRSVFGVGSDGETGFDREHVRLGSPDEPEALATSWYRPMDVGYPRVSGMSAIEGQATFTETEACFDWYEWCWASGPVEPVPHHSLLSAYGGEQPVMMNRKASKAGYGLKEAGVAWCFRTVVELRG